MNMKAASEASPCGRSKRAKTFDVFIRFSDRRGWKRHGPTIAATEKYGRKICKPAGEIRRHVKRAQSCRIFATRTWLASCHLLLPYRFDRSLACRALRWPKVKDVVGESRRLATPVPCPAEKGERQPDHSAQSQAHSLKRETTDERIERARLGSYCAGDEPLAEGDRGSSFISRNGTMLIAPCVQCCMRCVTG